MINLAMVLLDLALILVVARVAGSVAVRWGQPAVVGEIIAGLALGPSLLGVLPGHLDTLLFPESVRPSLSVIAQVGLILFMFLVGLEVNPRLLRRQGRLATTISLSSIAVPFGLGGLLAVLLYSNHDRVGGAQIPFSGFVLFLGISMSITAFPVLARILTERGLNARPLGVLALSCAALDDVLAWTLLALTVAVVSGGSLWGTLMIFSASVAFGLFMVFAVRPVLKHLVSRESAAQEFKPNLLAFTFAVLFFSAFATERIGIHAIFGAFLAGVIIPHEGTERFRRQVIERVEQVSVLLLLPVFFVTAGLAADVWALDWTSLGELGLILVVACAGKFVGATVAARAQAVPTRTSLALGILINTRGLTELIVIQIGRELGVLDTSLYTMLLLMALVTTIMTSPLLRVVYPTRLRGDLAESEPPAERDLQPSGSPA